MLPGVSWLFFRRALVPITPTSPMRALDRFFRTGADFTISGSLIADILFNEAESDSSCEFQARVFAVKGMPSLFAGVSSNRSVSRVWSPSHASAQLHVYRSIHMFSSFHLNRSTTTCRCNQNELHEQNSRQIRRQFTRDTNPIFLQHSEHFVHSVKTPNLSCLECGDLT